MCWEDRKEKDISQEINEGFYLERPNEKIFFPVDLTWEIDGIDSFKINDKYNVNLNDGLKKPVEVIEVDLKKYKNKPKENKKNER